MLDPAPTFNVPRLDGSFDILQIIDHHGRNSAQHPLFRYASANGATQTISWGGAIKGFDSAARFVLENVTFKTVDNTGAPPVVGILGNLDSISYYTLVIGIMKAGFTVFPISTRNSADGVAHLLAKTSCKLLFISNDGAVARLAEASCSLLESGGDNQRVSTVVVPSFDYFYNHSKENDAEAAEAVPSRVIVDPATPCVIIHSSGTVSFPKPITLTYQMFFEHGNQARLEGNLCGHIISIHGMPMYHLMGLKAIVYTALLGVTLGVFRPSAPPLIPTPDAVLSAAVATSSSRIFCAPSFLESWAKQQASVDALKGFAAILFGGGPIQVSIGNYLANEGVTLVPMLGMTEVGSITSIFPKHTHSEGWEWLALDPKLDFKFIRDESGENIYRFIVKQNALKTLAVVNATADDVPAYDTADLFIRHPTNLHLWKIYGRADEQIMHSSGEKTNPVPIEAGLTSSLYISGALMFGRARFQAGVLIDPSTEYKFDTADVEKTKQYLDLIWDTVQEVNRHSPQHSRIFKEMILIASPDKEFEYTPKGSLRRHVILTKYEQEIERLYEATESGHSKGTALSEIAQEKVPELDDLLPLVRSTVHNILSKSVGDEDDLFQAGADSLCALSIRNSITSELCKLQALSQHSIETLPADLIYYLPSISKISIFLYGILYYNRTSQHAYTNINAAEKHGTANRDNEAPKVLSEDEQWQKIQESKETVVEITHGNGETPLIILHGAPGTVGVFRPMLKSLAAIWVVQMLDDAPAESAESLVAFYHQKIKEKQPHGPYRLGSYSGSCAFLLELVTIFEQNDDEITQFVIMDHFPTLFISSLDLDTVALDSPEWWTPVLQKSFEGVDALLQNTKGATGVQIRLLLQEMQNIFNGQPGPPFAVQIIRNTTKVVRATLGFLLGERFTVEIEEGPNAGHKRFSPERFRLYTSKIKAKLTIYAATEGIRMFIPPSKFEDLGAREFFPDVIVKEIEGGHLDFLENEALLENLQIGY